MGFAQVIKAHYSNKNSPRFARHIVLPDQVTAIGAAVTVGGALTYGDWVDVALPAAVTTDTLVVGVLVDTPPVNMDVWTIDIGSTLVLGVLYANAAGVNAVPAAVIAAHRAEVRFEAASDAGVIDPIMLPFPIWIPNAVGIIARGYDVNDAGAHDIINVSVICVQNFE